MTNSQRIVQPMNNFAERVTHPNLQRCLQSGDIGATIDIAQWLQRNWYSPPTPIVLVRRQRSGAFMGESCLHYVIIDDLLAMIADERQRVDVRMMASAA